jgi:hypothetical protein
MRRRSVDLHGEASLGPAEVDAVTLDELGPRIGKAMALAKRARNRPSAWLSSVAILNRQAACGVHRPLRTALTAAQRSDIDAA